MYIMPYWLKYKGIEEDSFSTSFDEQTQIDISMLEQLTSVRGRLENLCQNNLFC